MAGLVVKVLMENGALVEEGQPILVLEAMKMEVNLSMYFSHFYCLSLVNHISMFFYHLALFSTLSSHPVLGMWMGFKWLLVNRFLTPPFYSVSR